MYKLSVKSEFSSAHNLRGYKGKCEALHGHNWKVEAVFEADETDKNGLVLDFHKIKDMLKGVLDQLDHKYLNEIGFFKKNNPTSENLARYIFTKISALTPASACGFGKGKPNHGTLACGLKEVTVWESDNCAATYSR